MSSSDTENQVLGESSEESKPKLSLDVKVASPSACQRHITVTVSQEDISRFYNEAYSKIMPDANVAGFRLGRAPRKLVEKSYKKQVSDQVKGSLLMDCMTQVSEEHKFAAISEPVFDFDAVELPDEGPMTFEFDIEVRPDFEMPTWKGLKIERPVRTIGAPDVESHLVELLQRYAVLEPVETPVQKGDYVVSRITFRHQEAEVAVADEQTIQVRSTLTFSDGRLKNFDKLVGGAKAGEKRTGKVSVSHSSHNAAIREQEVDAEFEILEVKQAHLPEMNEAFLSKLGDSVTAENLREYSRHDLERQLTYQQQRRVRQQITSLLTESASWELPPEMLQRQSRRELERAVMELRRSGFSDDQIRTRMNELKQNIQVWTGASLKEHFILERIAEDEKIEASDDDYDSEIMLIAQQEGESPRRVRARLEKRNLMDSLRNQIVERKVIELITSQAKFTDVPYVAESSEIAAIDFAIGGEQDDIPEAKHGGEAKELPAQVQRV